MYYLHSTPSCGIIDLKHLNNPRSSRQQGYGPPPTRSPYRPTARHPWLSPGNLPRRPASPRRRASFR